MKKILLITYFIIFSLSIIYSQTVDFTVADDEGCGNLQANFTSIVTNGGGYTAYKYDWDFGDGTTSTLENPIENYLDDGFYTVELTVTFSHTTNPDLIVTESKTDFIKVWALPVFSFTVDDEYGCEPLTTQLHFSETVTPIYGAAVNTFEWDFLDKIPASSDRDPILTDLSRNKYSVILTATDFHGCKDINIVQSMIEVFASPVVDFDYIQSTDCQPPYIVDFTNLSTIHNTTEISGYQWTFGDGGSSSSEDPSYTYVAAGDYTVTLTATSLDGCTASHSVPDLVQIRDFSIDLGQDNYTACADAIINFSAELNDGSGPVVADSWEWDMDNNGSVESTAQNPSYSFSSDGTYTAKITAFLNNGCEITETFADLTTVYAVPVPNIIVNETESCDEQFTFTFDATTSVDAVGYSWDFDDGTTVTLPVTSHAFNAENSFNVELTATNAMGCSATEQETITIIKPDADFTVDLDRGCTGTEVTFTDNSTSPLDAITSWEWTFDDGTSPVVTALDEMKHTYLVPGSFSVEMDITTASGCAETITKDNAVKIGLQPDVDLTGISTHQPECRNGTVYNFTAGDNTANTDSIRWVFHDGSDPEEGYTSDLGFTMDHTFLASGIYTVEVQTFYHGCASTVAVYPGDPAPGPSYAGDDVTVLEPTADFNFSPNAGCTGNSVFTFTSTSTGDADNTYEWSFDDGSPVATGSPIIHTFVNPGNYTVSLEADNDVSGCKDIYSEEIQVSAASPDFNVNVNEGCYPLAVNFTNTTVLDNWNVTWSWDFGDGSPLSSAENPSHTYQTPGLYTVTLTVTNPNSCTEVEQKTDLIRVIGGLPDFELEDPAAALSCEGTIVKLNNTTTYPQSGKGSFTWTFDPPDISHIGASNPASENISVSLDAQVDYTVTMRVQDDYGCEHETTVSDFITVHRLQSDFTLDRNTFCNNNIGQAHIVNFTNNSYPNTSPAADDLTFVWDFGKGPTYTMYDFAQQQETYDADDTYTVALSVTDEHGCFEYTSQEIEIVTPEIQTAVAVETALGCFPGKGTFQTTTTDDIIQWEWDFGDGTDVDIYNDPVKGNNPSHWYEEPGEYTANLTVLSAGQCTQQELLIPVKVDGPQGDFDMSDSLLCAPDEVTFTGKNFIEVKTLEWSYGDGSGVAEENYTDATTVVSHTYTSYGKKPPKLIITHDGFCKPREIAKLVTVSEPPSVEFQKKASGDICEKVEFEFTDLSTLRDPGQPISNWAWDFGDSQTESGGDYESVFHSYNNFGNYDVSLTVTNAFGCSESLEKVGFVDVVAQSNLSVGFNSNDPLTPNLVCNDDNVQFTSTSSSSNGGINLYEWIVDDVISGTNNTYQQLFPTKGGQYNVKLRVTDDAGCVDSTDMDIDVDNLVAGISTSPASPGGPNPQVIDFFDNSTDNTAAGFTINAWDWDFNSTSVANGSVTVATSILEDPIDIDFHADAPPQDYLTRLTVTDDEGCTATTTVTVSVSNNRPVISDFSVIGNEDEVLHFALSDFTLNFADDDPGHELVSVEVVNLPFNGTLELSSVAVTAGQVILRADLDNLDLVPDADWNGSTSFDWNATDGVDDAIGDKTITIHIHPVNDQPQANDDNYEVCEDGELLIAATGLLANDNETVGLEYSGGSIGVDLDVIAPFSFTSGNGGQLTLTADGALTYEPLAGYSGSEHFTYTISDNGQSGNPSSLSSDPQTDIGNIYITVHKKATIADAGSNQTICGPDNSIVLDGNAAANPGEVGEWSISGTGSVDQINNPLSPVSALTYDNTATLTWTITPPFGGCSQTSDDMTVFVSPEATVGANQSLCHVTTSFLSGNTPANVGLGTWVSDESATYANVNLGGTQVGNLNLSFAMFGDLSYAQENFTWTIDNNSAGGGCLTKDELFIRVYEQPVSDAGNDQYLCNASSTFLGALDPPYGIGDWDEVSGAGLSTNSDIDDETSNTSQIDNMTQGNHYRFEWTVDNGVCSDDDYSDIYNEQQAAAGVDQSVCQDDNFADMSANDPSFGTGTWSSPDASFNNINNWDTRAHTFDDDFHAFGDESYTTSTLTWTIDNNSAGGGCFTTDDIIVKMYESVTPPVAGSDIRICEETKTDAPLSANAPAVGVGEWSIVSVLPGGVTTESFVDVADESTSITGLKVGTEVILRWTITNGTCVAYDELTVYKSDMPNASAGAGTDQELCDATNTTLDANDPVVGTGTWNEATSFSANIVDPGDHQSQVNTISYGPAGSVSRTYTFTWTIDNGGFCQTSDDINVTIYEPPVADAGNEDDVCADQFYTLDATPAIVEGEWSSVSGSGNVVFSSTVNDPNARIDVDQYDDYTFQWTVVNGTCPAETDQVIIHFWEQPVTNAGSGGETCDNEFALNATSSVGTGTWSKFSGPGSLSFTPDANTPNATVTASSYGTYEIQWQEINGTCNDDDVITVKFRQIPDADAGAPATIGECDTHNLDATSSTSHAVEDPALAYSWSPSTYLSDAGIANPLFTPGVTTAYTLTATDIHGCEDTDNVTITVNEASEVSVTAIDATASETATNKGQFRIFLDYPNSQDTRVDFNFTGSIAVNGSDYTFEPSFVIIPACETEAFIDIEPIDDNILEYTEDVDITLTATDDATVTPSALNDQATVSILDNESLVVEYDLATSSDLENIGGNIPGLVVSGAVTDAFSPVVEVDISLSNIDTENADWAQTSATVTIPIDDYTAAAGETVALPAAAFGVVNDALFEFDETVTLGLTNHSNITTGDADNSGGTFDECDYTIIDEDDLVVEYDLATSSDLENIGGNIPGLVVSGAEIDANSPVVTVDVSLSNIDTENADWTQTSATVTIPLDDYTAAAGETVALPAAAFGVVDDDLFEFDETVTLGLTNHSNITTGDADNSGGTFDECDYTIIDEDDLVVEYDLATSSDLENIGGNIPGLVVSGGETDANSPVITVDVSLSNIDTENADWTQTIATVIIPLDDYTAAAGETVALPAAAFGVVDDDLFEFDETVTLGLTNHSNITTGDADNSGGTFDECDYTIIDEDDLVVEYDLATSSDLENIGGNIPGLVVSGAETDANSPVITVDVSLSNIDTENADWVQTSATVTIPIDDYTAAAGETVALPAAAFGVVDDNLFESDETVTLGLTNHSNITTGDADNSGGTFDECDYTIIDEDDLVVEYDLATSSDLENIGGNIPGLVVSGAETDANSPVITVDVSLSNIDTENADWTQTSATVTIPLDDYTAAAGETVALPAAAFGVVNDDLFEFDETVTLGLTNHSNIITGDADNSGGTFDECDYIIIDEDDLVVEYDLATSSDLENIGGNIPGLVVSGAETDANSPVVTVDVSLSNIDTENADWTQTNATITIPIDDYTAAAGETVALPVAAFDVVDDDLFESDETVTLGFINHSNITTGDADNSGGTFDECDYTIIDEDDLVVEYDLATSSDLENVGGNIPGLVVSGAETDANSPVVTVDVSLSNIDTENADWTQTSATVTIPIDDYTAAAGETVALPAAAFGVVDDDLFEFDETVTLGLTNHSNITTGDADNSGGTFDECDYTIIDEDDLVVEYDLATSSDLENIGGNIPGLVVSGGETDANSPVITVDVSLSNIDTENADWTQISATVTIPIDDYTAAAGETVALPAAAFGVVNDALFEFDETVTLGLTNHSNITTGDADNSGGTFDECDYTIIDEDDLVVEYDLATSSDLENIGGNIPGLVVSGAKTDANSPVITVDVSLVNIDTENADWAQTSATVTIPIDDYTAAAGETVALPAVAFGVVNDDLFESDETVTLGLINHSNITTGDADNSGGTFDECDYTIIDEDDLVVEYDLATSSDLENIGGNIPGLVVSGAETDANSPVITVDVSLSNIDSENADWTQTNATITIPIDDYTAAAGETVALPAAAFGVVNDALFEFDETVTLGLTNHSNITTGDADNSGGTFDECDYTIIDEDDLVVEYDLATSSDLENVGGNIPGLVVSGGETDANSPVVTVDVSLSNIDTENADWTQTSATVTIPIDDYTAAAGETVALPAAAFGVVDDDLFEFDETVTLGLTNHSNITTGDADNSGGTFDECDYTIIDEDDLVVEYDLATSSDLENVGGNIPGLVVSGAETDANSPVITVDVSLSNIDTENADWTQTSATVTIPLDDYTAAAGETVALPAAAFGVVDDDLFEFDETVTLGLTNHSNITTGDADNSGSTFDECNYTIIDEDDLFIEFSTEVASDVESVGGNIPDLIVGGGDLDGNSPPVTVDINLVNISTENPDWIQTNATVTIPFGEHSTVTTLTLPTAAFEVFDDNIVEYSEVVELEFINHVNISTGDANSDLNTYDDHEYTIIDDEAAYIIVIAGPDQPEPTGSVEFTFRMDKPSANPSSLEFSLSGLAIVNTDYGDESHTVTIPAGDLETTVSFATINDDIVEGSEAVTLVAVEMETADPHIIISNTQDRGTVLILDDDEAYVSITANDDYSNESGNDGQYTIRIDHLSSRPTVVSLSYSGSANEGDDYDDLPSSVTIPVMTSFVRLDMNPRNDNIVEPTEYVIATITNVSGNPGIFIDQNNRSATIDIEDNDNALVSISSPDDRSDESGGNTGTFRVSMTNPSATDTEIEYILSGTADTEHDYEPIIAVIEIPAGETEIDIQLIPIQDDTLELDETVIMTLTDVSVGLPAISISTTNYQSTIIIEDPNTSSVSIVASDELGHEAGPDSAMFEIILSTASATDTKVTYAISGGAGNDVDFEAIVQSIIIPSGELSVPIDIIPLPDSIIEGTEMIILTLENVSEGHPAISINNSAREDTAYILDATTGLVSIIATDPESYEAGPDSGQFMISLDSISTEPTEVVYLITGTATDSIDYIYITDTATIPAGAFSVMVDIIPFDDDIYEGAETVILTLTEIASGNPGISIDEGNKEAQVTIGDSEPVNNPPVSVDDYEEGMKDNPVTGNILTNDYEPDGDSIVVTLTPVLLPAHGTVELLPDGEFIYTPDTGFTGQDIFYYQICDDIVLPACSEASVEIIITDPVHVAVNDTIVVNENETISDNVLPNDTLPAGKTYSVDVEQTTGPEHGTVVLNTDGSYTYTTELDYTGDDEFTYTVCTNEATKVCKTAKVLITVLPVNHPPVAVNDTIAGILNTLIATEALLNDYDPDGDSLIVQTHIISGPGSGNAKIDSAGNFSYGPNEGFTGIDSVVYSVCDNGTPSLCDTALIYITVLPVNNPPVAVRDSFSGEFNSKLSGNIMSNDFDPDNDNMIISSVPVSGPHHGSVTINADGSFVYTPNDGFTGIDSAQYQICDNGAPGPLCSTGTIVFVIAPQPNDPPVAVNDTVQTFKDVSEPGNVKPNDLDPDGDSIYVDINQLTLPKHGQLEIDSTGQFVYTPDDAFTGLDSFIYVICDDRSPKLCDDATVIIEVSPVNTPPVANNDTISVNMGATAHSDVLPNDSDPDGDNLTVSLLDGSGPENGTLTLHDDGTYSYIPNEGFSGIDEFEYVLCDDGVPSSSCDTAIVIITVKEIIPDNNPPIAENDTLETLVGEAVIITPLTNDSDPDGDSLDINKEPVAEPEHGTVTFNDDGSFTYLPDDNFSGIDTFIYEVCDTEVTPLCCQAVVYINIIPINEPPIAVDDEFETDESTAVNGNVLPNDSDPEGDELVINTSPISGPENGTLTILADGSFEFVPNEGFTGVDKFTYEICDHGQPVMCSNAEVTITVHGAAEMNHPPVAVNDTIIGDMNIPLSGNIITNDSDPDGDTLIINIQPIEGPEHGTLTINGDGTIEYEPEDGFTGGDKFTYQICDNAEPSLCSQALVVLQINSVNAPPMAEADYAETDQGEEVEIEVLLNDVDPDGNLDEESVSIIQYPESGAAIIRINKGEITVDYSLIPDYSGEDYFIYQVCDTEGACDRDTVFVTVKLMKLIIPEGFSPNGDNVNDYFVIPGIGNYPNNEIIIFNRWGNEVFRQKHYNNDWDGVSKGPRTIGHDKLPTGTYFYILKPGNGEKDISGYIYLTR